MAELLVLQGVSKGYLRGGRWTASLVDVSLEVGLGEVGAVVGARAAGKTTLLQAAAGTVLPDKGRVVFGGRDLAGLRRRERQRLLGREIRWVDGRGPQEDLEVCEWIGWPLALGGWRREEAERMAAEQLARVGAESCKGRKWPDLSDAQRVLVGLAMGFVGSPRLVIIDDLLGSLQGFETDQTFDLLRSLVEESGCAVLMSASTMESAIFADRVWSLNRKGGLKAMSAGSASGADIIPFPRAEEA